MIRVVVFLKEDYSESDEFTMDIPMIYGSDSKEEVDKEVNKRYLNWYYYDIWNAEEDNPYPKSYPLAKSVAIIFVLFYILFWIIVL